MKAGRRTLYFTNIQPELERIPKLKRQGLTDDQIAEVLGVRSTSFTTYKSKYPELREALKKGRERLIEDLEDTIYKRALGKCRSKTTKKYIEEVNGVQKTKIEETVQELPPDTGALCFCLKNLAPSRWRELRDVNFTDLEERLKNVKSLSEKMDEISDKDVEDVEEESPI